MKTALTKKMKVIEHLDLMEMCAEVDKVLGFRQRACGKHFHPDTGDFQDWCNATGKGQTDPDGKERESSQIWFKEYNESIANGDWKDTPYMDFWHWQIDHAVGNDFGNDRFSTIYVGMDDYTMSKAEPWQQEIQKVWHDLYYDMSDEGTIYVWVSW